MPTPSALINAAKTAGKTTTGRPVGSALLSAAGKGPKPTTPDAGPWQPVLSFGQTLLNTLATPMYFLEGQIAAGGQISGGIENVQNAFAGKKTITGADLLEKAGWKDAGFIPSLAVDILLDPLTYTPGVFISAPIKAFAKAGTTAAKGAKYAAQGLVAGERGASRAVGEAAATTINRTPTFIKSGYTEASPGAGGAILRESVPKMRAAEIPLYKTGERGTVDALLDIANNAVIGAWKGAMMSTKRSFTNEALRLTAKADRKAAKNQVDALAGTTDATGLGTVQSLLRNLGENTPTSATESAVEAAVKTGKEVAAEVAAKQPTPTVAPAVSILDSEPNLLDVATAKASNVMTVKDAKARLRAADKVAKTATAGGGDVAASILRLLPAKQDVEATPVALFRSFEQAIDAKGKVDTTAIVPTLKEVAQRYPKTLEGLAATAGADADTVRGLATGTVKIGSVSKESLKNIAEAMKRYPAQNSATAILARIKAAVSEQLSPKAVAALDKAGAFTTGRFAENEALIQDIVAKATAGMGTKTYKNVTELVAGIQAGDRVAPDVLANVLRALDPEHQILKSADVAAGTNKGYEMLKELLGKKVPYTVEQTKKRIEAAKPEVLLGQQVAYGDVIALAIDGARDGVLKKVPEVVKQTRDTARNEFEAFFNSSDSEVRSRLRFTLDSIARGLRGEGSKILNALESGKFETGKLGFIVAKTDKNGTTEAFMPELFSQYVETRIWASMAAKRSNKEAFKAKAAKAKGKAGLVEVSNPISYIAAEYTRMRPAILGIFGVRMVNVRSLSEVSDLGGSYHAYIDFGDLATLAQGTPAEEALIRGFFPVGSKYFPGLSNPAKNTFQHQSIMRVAVKAMEAAEKGSDYPRAKMIEDMMEVFDADGRLMGKPGWDAKYAKEAPKIAEELVDFVESVKPQLIDIHKTRALAELDDLLSETHRMAEDIFMPVLDAVRAMTTKGITADSVRVDMVWEALMKFAATSDILRAETGSQAQALFRSAARLFMTLGDIDDLVKATTKAAEGGNPRAAVLANLIKSQKTGEPTAEFKRLVEDVNAIQINRSKTAEMLPAVERFKVPAAEMKLAMAYDEFEKAAGQFGKIPDDEFTKAVKAAGAKLERARVAAMKLGLPTKHWSAEKAASDPNGIGWVDSVAYNWNKEQLFIRTSRAAARDVKPTRQKKKPALGKQLRKTRTAQIFVINKKVVDGQIAQATEDLAEQVKQVEELTPDPTAQAARLLEEHSNMPTQSAVIRIPEDNPYFYPTTYQGAKSFYNSSRVEAVAGNYSAENLSFIQRMGDKVNPVGERALTRGMYKRLEASTMRTVADVDGAIRRMWAMSEQVKMAPEQFDQAFSNALRMLRERNFDIATGNQPIDDLSKGLFEILSETKAKIDAVVLDPAVLQKVLAKHGINAESGFIDVRNSDPEDIFFELFDNAPFGPKPIDDGTDAAKEAIRLWEDRNANYKKRFAKGDADGAFTSIAKIVSAMQFAVMQHTMSAEIVARFNYAAEGLSKSEALARGYVRIEGRGTGFSFTENMPQSIDEGNLFHPDIARSIGTMNREFNRTFNSNDFAKWLQGTMEITQMLKATQTILRPGHLATTIVGDWGLSLMINPFNLKHWAMAMRINKEYAKFQMQADYKALGTIQNSVDRAVASIAGVGQREFEEAAAGTEYLSVLINGKLVRVSLQDAVNRFSDNAVLTGNMQTNEAALLDLEVASRARGFFTDSTGTDIISSKVKAGQNLNKARAGWQKFIQPAGDLVAYTSNPARLVTALRVLEEGSFRSIDDAFEQAADRVRLYHPTMDSLTASERRGPRLFFSYYTWLRGAHTAMFDMMLNHTAMMLLPSKIFYNQAEANNMEPNSLGNMWGNKMNTPQYLDYSVYGPTMEGPRGGLIYKPSVLQLDVLDTWNLTWDPNLTAGQNAMGTVNTLGRTLLGQSNMVLQPLAQTVTGTNLRTGKPDQIENLQEFGDKYVQLLGFTQALKGLGLYTPYNKIDNQTNPQTPRDEQLAGLNWLFGQRIGDTATPSAIRNAKLENTETRKNIIDRLLREMEQNG